MLKKKNDVWLTKTEFAKLHGVTLRAITYNIEQGNIHGDALQVEENGSRKYYKIHKDIGSEQYSLVHIEKKQEDQQEYNAKQKYELYRAKKAQLDYEERIGKLIEKDAVLKFVGDIAIEHRDRMRSIPDRIIPKIYAAVKSNETEEHIYSMLKDEIDSALDDLSRKSEHYED